MAKSKTTYFCQSCGAESPKWLGKCPSCHEWNTLVEEIVVKTTAPKNIIPGLSNEVKKPKSVAEIAVNEESRYLLHDGELNRVLGGGLVPGSVILLGGEPGIGKSTLLLQLALKEKKLKTLYVSGEESESQIKMRAERLGISTDNCFILTETQTQNIFAQMQQLEPELLIVDSIQTLSTAYLESAPGTVSQIRECAAELIKYAKQTSTPVFLVGHITKDGQIAGPKVLEHMVDTVLQFEGDRNQIYRLIRSVKNRFGSTNELGIYEMQGAGLKEVSNPSEILISNRNEDLSGIAIGATLEGMRPMLIETQALVSSAAYGTPQRSSTGYDTRRMNMLLAVLEKRCGFRLGAKDVFLNITGGIKIDDPAVDLPIVCAILSSNEDVPIDKNVCFAAEVGLSGEIRPVTKVDQRISEAQKLGFERIVISKGNLKGLDQKKFTIEIIPVSKIEEVYKLLFG